MDRVSISPYWRKCTGAVSSSQLPDWDVPVLVMDGNGIMAMASLVNVDENHNQTWHTYGENMIDVVWWAPIVIGRPK